MEMWGREALTSYKKSSIGNSGGSLKEHSFGRSVNRRDCAYKASD
jgi:hypothetical protein